MGLQSAFKIFLVTIGFLAVGVSTSVRGSDRADAAADRRWAKRTVTLSISRSLSNQSPAIKFGSDVEAAATSAANLWSAAAAVAFRFGGTDIESVSGPRSGGDGVSLVTVAATSENLALFPNQSSSPPAFTRLFFDRKGTIIEADVVLNPFVQFSTDGTPGTFDLQRVFVHEFGHAMGLSHSSAVSSVMFGRMAENGQFVGRTSAYGPSDADISALRELYGPAEGGNDCCVSFFGTFGNRSGGRFVVWAEDAFTGRLLGAKEIGGGVYEVGGLMSGRYRLFAQNVSYGGAADLGEYLAEMPMRIKRTPLPIDAKAEISFVGLNAELAAAPLSLRKGNTYSLFLGGSGLVTQTATFGSSSKHITVLSERPVPINYGKSIEAVVVNVSVDAATPDGDYSIYVESPAGARRYMIGALSIR